MHAIHAVGQRPTLGLNSLGYDSNAPSPVVGTHGKDGLYTDDIVVIQRYEPQTFHYSALTQAFC